MDLPVVFDAQLAAAGQHPYRWDDEHRAWFGVLPRARDGASVQWFEVAPCYVWHTNQYGYTTSFSLDVEPHHSKVYKYDFGRGSARSVHRFPAGHTCGEAVFVPEAADPIAEVHIPARIPTGFHGNWMPLGPG